MTTESGAQPTRPQAQGALERIEHAFEELMAWGAEHWTLLLGALGVLVVLGGAGAAFYEIRESQRADAFAGLAAVERDLARALPPDEDGINAAEPANPELGIRAREAALAGFDALTQEHAGTIVGDAATLRAAEMEIDLDRPEAADARLESMIQDPSDPIMRATALRLRGYVLDVLGRPLEAAQLFMAAAAEQRYLGRGDAYWQAGLTFERAGELQKAVEAYDAAISAAPEFAERAQIAQRLDPLRQRLERASSAPAQSASEAPKPEAAAPEE